MTRIVRSGLYAVGDGGIIKMNGIARDDVVGFRTTLIARLVSGLVSISTVSTIKNIFSSYL